MGTLFEIDHATGAVDFKQKGTSNLIIEKGTSFPGTPVDGHLVYRTDLNQLFVYDNGLTDWKTQAGGSLRIYNETPSGAINDVNTVFTVVSHYVSGSTIVTRNGLVMKPGDDYTESNPSTGQITFSVAPSSGSTVLVSYSRTIGQDVPKLLKFTVEVGTPSGTYSGSTTVFDLPFNYTPGTGSLLVFSSGVIMAVGAGADYQETDSDTVTFNTARTGGEVIQFLKLGVANDLGNTGGWTETAGAVTVETITNQVRIGDGSGTTPALAFSSDTTLGFFKSGTNKIGVAGNGAQIAQWEASGVGGTNTFSLSNSDNTDAGSNARLYVLSGGASGGDAFSVWQIPGATSWALGVDNSDSDTFKLSNQGTLGGNDRLVVSTAGQLRFVDGSAGTPTLSFINDPDTGIYRDATNRLAISAGGSKVADFRGTTTADATDHVPFSFFGGTSFGGGAAGVNYFLRTTASVTTSPVDIGPTAYGLIVVTGLTGGGASIFVDLLLDAYGTVPIVVANRETGSPAARTYSLSGDRLLLAMASGTYSVAMTVMSVPIR